MYEVAAARNVVARSCNSLRWHFAKPFVDGKSQVAVISRIPTAQQ